jgi:methylthioribose-1-phosphate isomerase
MPVQTLEWRDGALELLDQRRLPDVVQTVRCRDAESTARAIREMVVRGAPAIGVAAAYGVAAQALRLAEAAHTADHTPGTRLEDGFAMLAASRPTAVNLFWALDRMQSAWHRLAGIHGADARARIAQGLVAEASAIHREDIEANLAMGRHGAELLADGARVLTHCNAGALATAGHGTALGVIRSAVAAGKRISVIADETRPVLQGARLTAWEMVQENIPVTLIADGMAGHLMARGDVDAVIVGADRVAANADVANKIGTYMVAVLAERHGIPFYVACPVSTIDMTMNDGDAIPIEERADSEVLGFREMRWASTGVQVRNPAFDITPASLISALITEHGVMRRPDAAQLDRLLRSNSTRYHPQ